MPNIDTANTNIGQTLAWLDELEGQASNLRLSNSGTINGPALEAYMRNIEGQVRRLADAMRVSLHAAREALGGE